MKWIKFADLSPDNGQDIMFTLFLFPENVYFGWFKTISTTVSVLDKLNFDDIIKSYNADPFSADGYTCPPSNNDPKTFFKKDCEYWMPLPKVPGRKK